MNTDFALGHRRRTAPGTWSSRRRVRRSGVSRRSEDLPLAPVEGVLNPADEVAAKIVECIERPVAEVYTHSGSREFVELAARDREGAEKMLLAVVLGEREIYGKIATKTRRHQGG